MQTFLPYECYSRTAAILDRQRLGKQRVEVLQILEALAGRKDGWRNHPAVLMWRGYEGSLIRYGAAICREWIDRGYRDTCCDKILAFVDDPFPAYERHPTIVGRLLPSEDPEWLGDPGFHLSHQSNLVRKDPDHYGPLFPGVPDDLPYVWPA